MVWMLDRGVSAKAISPVRRARFLSTSLTTLVILQIREVSEERSERGAKRQARGVASEARVNYVRCDVALAIASYAPALSLPHLLT